MTFIRTSLTVFALVLTLRQEPPNPPLAISVNVNRVSVDVYVDVAGKPATNLTVEDFTVFDNGETREIRDFFPADAPYNILLLFDRSSSTRDQWRFLIGAAFRFVQQLPEHDRIALAAFDDKPEMLADWTNPRDFPKNFDLPAGGGGTDVYGAVEWAIGRFRGLKGRKGVIVLTDGVDSRLSKALVRFGKNGSPSIAPPDEDGDFKKMLRAVAQSATPIYFVGVNTDQNPDPKADLGSFDLLQRKAGRLRMELTASMTGGLVHYPKEISDVAPYYENIAKSLGSSYTLVFAPLKLANDGSRHRIEVRVRDKTMNVTQLKEEYIDR